MAHVAPAEQRAPTLAARVVISAITASELLLGGLRRPVGLAVARIPGLVVHRW